MERRWLGARGGGIADAGSVGVRCARTADLRDKRLVELQTDV